MRESEVSVKNATSTVGRGKPFASNCVELVPSNWSDGQVNLFVGDSLNNYDSWEQPATIISDGAYGI